MEIIFTYQHIYFYLFYFLAFIFLTMVVIRIGRRQGYRYSTLLLFLGTITLATILGSRLATIPMNAWPNLLLEDETSYMDRSAIGGVFLGLVALILSQKSLKLSNKFIIHFVWITPIGLAIQKLGCFINGCCFGSVCSNFLGIQYPKNTFAHLNHWNAGFITDPEVLSLPVYPVQLFEIAAFVLVAIVGWKLRKKWSNVWSALWLGLFFLFAARFGLEFLRDPIGSQFGMETILGLRSIQWAILLLSTLFLTLFFLSERELNFFRRVPIMGKFQLFLIVSSLTILFHGLFLTFEWVVLWFTLLPALGIYVFQYRTSIKASQKWGWVMTALIIPMIVIAQTIDTLNLKMEKFHEVSVGVNTGVFYNLLEYDPVTTSGCVGTSTSYTREPFKHEYSAFGAGYSRVERNELKSTRWGIYGYIGNIDSKALTLGSSYSNTYWGFSPYIQYDRRWWGIGAGIQGGKFYVASDDKIQSGEFENAVEERTIWPSIYGRFGHRKYLDVIYRYGDLFPTPYPTTFHQISIGTGLLQDYDYGLRYGKFFPGGEFISAEGIIQDRFGVKLMYVMKDDYDFGYGFELPENKSAKWVFSVFYRFGGDLKK